MLQCHSQKHGKWEWTFCGCLDSVTEFQVWFILLIFIENFFLTEKIIDIVSFLIGCRFTWGWEMHKQESALILALGIL